MPQVDRQDVDVADGVAEGTVDARLEQVCPAVHNKRCRGGYLGWRMFWVYMCYLAGDAHAANTRFCGRTASKSGSGEVVCANLACNDSHLSVIV